jgi:hypothetical protein
MYDVAPLLATLDITTGTEISSLSYTSEESGNTVEGEEPGKLVQTVGRGLPTPASTLAIYSLYDPLDAL